MSISGWEVQRRAKIFLASAFATSTAARSRYGTIAAGQPLASAKGVLLVCTSSSFGMPILAFDAGTSSVKAVVASQSSQGGWVVHAHACSAHDPPHARATGEAEQSPHSWWEALARVVRMLSEQTDLDAVEAISLSGQMQSVILVDAAGAAVRTTLTLILTCVCGFVRTMSS